MIAKLSGLIDSLGDDWAVIDVGGVGYLVSCSVRTLGGLAVGEAATLHVETHVRDDRIQLFGFLDRVERDWFRLLYTVQGVGTKVALAILGAVAADRLAPAIASGDKAALTRAPGVGPRLAARIVAELQEKVAALEFARAPITATAMAATGAAPAKGGASSAGGAAVPDADAVSALVNLGYSQTDAYTAVVHARLALGADARIEDLIRRGLAQLGPRDLARERSS